MPCRETMSFTAMFKLPIDIVDLRYYELTKDLETGCDSKYVLPLNTLIGKKLITDPDVIITGI